jgi:hypothetical protein
MTETTKLAGEVQNLAEELLARLDGDDPRCELLYSCDDHGDEECGGRARWVMTILCPHRNHYMQEQVLVCDDCHDMISNEGDVLGQDHKVVWRPL